MSERKLNLNAITGSSSEVRKNNNLGEKIVDSNANKNSQIGKKNVENVKKESNNLYSGNELEPETKEADRKISLSSIKENAEKNSNINVEGNEIKIETIKDDVKEQKHKNEIFENYKSDFSNPDYNPVKDLEENYKEKGFTFGKTLIPLSLVLVISVFAGYFFLNSHEKINDKTKVNIIENKQNNEENKQPINKIDEIRKEVGGYEYKIVKTISDDKETFEYNGAIFENMGDLEKVLEKESENRRQKDLRRKTIEKIVEKYKN